MNVSALFGLLLILCLLINGRHLMLKVSHPAAFVQLQRRYLLVYTLALVPFWLQTLSAFSLYQSYNYQMHSVITLLIIEFLSSAVFGTFVGSLADKFGRKNSCLLYALTYSLSCITKLSSNFSILFFGHFLGGISTSLLFSVFEAWMVCEHRKAGFSDELLSETFSLATLINGFIAIVSGLLADLLAGSFGFVSPFMAALVCLVVVGFVIHFTWRENYGNAQFDLVTTFSTAINELTGNNMVMALGLIQSLYELAVCSLFLQLPLVEYQIISVNIPGLPFGLVFAAYMVCVMIGSAIFHFINESHSYPVETLASFVFAISSLTFLVPIVLPEGFSAMLFSFCTIGLLCGTYWPCIGTMRGRYLKEECRAALMNFFRVPLNLFVVHFLFKAGSIAASTIFTVCFLGLILALITQLWLSRQHCTPLIPEYISMEQNSVAKHN